MTPPHLSSPSLFDWNFNPGSWVDGNCFQRKPVTRVGISPISGIHWGGLTIGFEKESSFHGTHDCHTVNRYPFLHRMLTYCHTVNLNLLFHRTHDCNTLYFYLFLHRMHDCHTVLNLSLLLHRTREIR
jgi:hypothetical protein